MVDRLTRQHRSWNMSRIRGGDTAPEKAVRSILHGLGLRFRLNRRDLPGRPDVLLPRWNTALFVHGCFWHRHPGCRYAYYPKSRLDFWSAKFLSNKLRDRSTARALRRIAWGRAVIWECQTGNEMRLRGILLARVRRRKTHLGM